MLSDFFYHKTIRRVTAVFGTLFNNIHIRNVNTDGSTIKESRVPIAYGPKEKWLDREQKEKDFETNQRVAIQLPRLSFEITSFQYDTETTTSMLRRVTHNTVDENVNVFSRQIKRTYTGTPYKLGMQLNIMARSQDEVLQILEQILPYFKPDFVVTIKQLDGMESVWDMPITLTSVSPSDSYEGDFETRRTIIYTLDFELLVRFFGPISDQGVIHKVIANIYDLDGDPQFSKIEVEAVPSSPSENDQGYIINTSITNELF